MTTRKRNITRRNDDTKTQEEEPFWQFIKKEEPFSLIAKYIGFSISLSIILGLVGLLPRLVVVTFWPKEMLPTLQWWQTGGMYHVGPGHLPDSNGDGMGDLAGLHAHLKYLAHINVQTLVLGPVYETSDSSNTYRAINSTLGTMNDLVGLLQGIHNAGRHLILDFVLNHGVDKQAQDIEVSIRFWLDKGVDGIRFVFNSSEDQKKAVSYVSKWREIFNDIGKVDGKQRCLMVHTVDASKDTIKQFYTQGVDMVIQDGAQILGPSCGGLCVDHVIRKTLARVPEGKWPSWIVDQHGSNINALNILQLLLPGTPLSSFGGEIENEAKASGAQAQNQWVKLIEEVQKTNEPKMASIKLYRKLSLLRDTPTFKWGAFKIILATDSIFSFSRDLEGHRSYLIVINFGIQEVEENLFEYSNGTVAQFGVVEANTANFNHGHYDIGKQINFGSVRLKAGEGLVVRYYAR